MPSFSEEEITETLWCPMPRVYSRARCCSALANPSGSDGGMVTQGEAHREFYWLSLHMRSGRPRQSTGSVLHASILGSKHHNCCTEAFRQPCLTVDCRPPTLPCSLECLTMHSVMAAMRTSLSFLASHAVLLCPPAARMPFLSLLCCS